MESTRRQPTIDAPTLDWVEPGRNCWKRARARRASVIPSTELYFRAFKEVVSRARHSVGILGWDIHGEIELERRELQVADWPNRLGDFLSAVARARPELQIRMLSWDYPGVYAGERQKFQVQHLDWMTPDNVSFHKDDVHPAGGSHHQKLVVIDDALAFVGGIDLSLKRWDTTDHLPDDPHRVSPDGDPYPPFHDAQIVADGEVGAAIGALFRERWIRATGEHVQAPAREVVDAVELWPPSVDVDFEEVDVAIARTWPRADGKGVEREIESLYVDMFRHARHWIYLENQYVSSEHILSVLAERLREPDGPEVVLVAPRQYSGALEDEAMGPLRDRLVGALIDADVHGRFRALYPSCREGETEKAVYVHAKFGVVDDVLVRLGSANLADRSMGVDTECDAAILATTSEQRRGVRRVLERFLAMHLGLPVDEVQRRLDERDSLVGLVDDGRGGEHCLAELPLDDPDGTPVPEIAFDPAVPYDQGIDELVSRSRRRRWPWIVGGAVAAAALTGLWLRTEWRQGALGG